MKNLLPLHAIALNGDGLAPRLLDLLSRQAEIAANPKVVELRRFRKPVAVEAGPDPAERLARVATPAAVRAFLGLLPVEARFAVVAKPRKR